MWITLFSEVALLHLSVNKLAYYFGSNYKLLSSKMS